MKRGLWAVGSGLGSERANARPRLPRHESRITNHTATALVAFAFLTLSGCSNIEPWVKPYERAALADPIMSMDPNPVSSAYTHHVYEAREGARGALGSAGGGCGCN